jgi:hypothetical protein
MIDLQGSYLPFTVTRAERNAHGDPRRSVEERYAGREQYLERVGAEAEALAADGVLLAADVPRIVARAGRHWDLLTGRDPVQ